MARFLPLYLILSLIVSGCGNLTDKKSVDEDTGTLIRDSRLTFKDVTLQQFDEQGRLLWRVKAKQARYSNDKKIAKIQDPSGELFQDGKLVFRIKAKQGEVQQDGQKIFLKEEITATMVQDGATLKGQELEWIPKQDLLIVRRDLKGNHPQVQASAKEARAYSRSRRLELVGNVIAVVKEPTLRLQAEKLVWQLPKQLVTTDQPIQIDRLVKQVPTDRITGKKAVVDLKAKTATVSQEVQLTLVDPPVTVNGAVLTWNLGRQTVISEKPLKIVHREQQVTLTASQGQFDLKPQVFYLVGGVRVIGVNQSQLEADTLTWAIPTQELLAEGNVSYRQVSPPFSLIGPRALGRLQEQTIVISGGNVVTEIVP
ncbi:LPS export ABC transporter periplasmic protein LptC [Leptolyngbya sp. 'hensonii']|uniref:LPS export ABC transporter periplasmic protein LptC n=1 Tax=Leptolyngbya sp. 'hensonii' TaxID=1922337 RepID=UPI0009F9ECA1|nr:LPS export ABC transporter periplasmic protein LptC [Leptolyngbya sp. 'hensonii']